MVNLTLIYRNLTKTKGIALLNILGLGIGLACSLAMISWVRSELTYDRDLPDADMIYRLTFETNNSGNRIHFARCYEEWILKFPGYFPQIEQLVRLSPYRHTAIKANENKFYSDKVFATDSNFFKVFDIKLFSGDPEKVLNEPFCAVISSTLAGKCFGNSDPVGKTISMSGEYDTKMTLFTVRGVMNDSPVNSHIHFDIVTSFEKPGEMPEWAYVYLLLAPNASPGQILSRFPEFMKANADESEQGRYKPFLQKITDIHLYSDKDREIEPNGNITGVYLFILISVILLVISWTNHFNLSKAKMLSLQKQISVQMISGSGKTHLVIQSLAESAIVAIMAFAVAGFLLDLFSGYSGRLPGISVFQNGLSDTAALWYVILPIFLLTMLAGSLPLIRYVGNEHKITFYGKEAGSAGKKRLTSYVVLLTAQFALSVFMMVAAITIKMQNDHMLALGPGKESPDVMVFKRQNWEIRFKYDILRTKALQSPLIKEFTASIEEPSGETLDALQVESGEIGKGSDEMRLFVLAVEDNFLDFFNIPLIAGRNFTKYNPARKGEDYILNETAARRMGWTPEEAIGKPFRIKFDDPDIFFGGTVTGVVKDFNFNTAKQKIKPYVLFQKPIFYLCFLVKIDPGRRSEAVSYIKKIWEEELPDYPFQFEFLGDTYRNAYAREIVQGKLTGLFSILAVIIICFGILTITSLLVVQKTKEIGIRKVNGARLPNILLGLNREFLLSFLAAFLIACPAAWYFMNKWLQGFVYHIRLNWWVFAVSGLIILAVTLITVTLQSLKAALRNPVESLRYE